MTSIATNAVGIRHRLKDIESSTLVIALIVLLFVVGWTTTPGFLAAGNLGVILQFSAPTLIVALGLATVVIGKGIDLSVGAMVVVAPQVVLQLVAFGVAEATAIVVVAVCALLFGLLNGWLVAVVGVPALIATLGTAQLLLGGVKVWLLESNYYPVPADSFLGELAFRQVFGIPSSVAVAVVLTIATIALWQFTSFGRVLRGLGDNFATARNGGAPVRGIQVSTYAISAVLACVAGFFIASREGSVTTTATAFSPMIFVALTAVVIGGVSLSGGRGSVLGVVAGTLFIGIITNLLTLNSFSQAAQNFVQAAALLSAVLLDALLHPREEETAKSGDL
jgi:ribose transport system permease protein